MDVREPGEDRSVLGRAFTVLETFSAEQREQTLGSIQQRAGEKRFSSVVQLLEAGGERLVRFSYATSGTAR